METELLRRIPLFSELSETELRELLAVSEKRRYPKGNIVLYRGDAGRIIYLILTGCVSVVLNDERGKEVILRKLEPGNYFGEMAVFDRMPRSATVITSEESEFLIVTENAIKGLIERNPKIALKLIREMSIRLRETNDQLSDLALLDVKGRIAKILLKLTRKCAIEKGVGYVVVSRPPVKEISAMSGASRETVSRVLGDFSREGIITLKRDRIIVYEET